MSAAFSHENNSTDDGVESLDTPEKLQELIENLRRDRQELLTEQHFLQRILWFVAMHSGDGKGAVES